MVGPHDRHPAIEELRQALWERRREKVRDSAFGTCQRVGLYLRISHEDNPRFLDRPCEELVKASTRSTSPASGSRRSWPADPGSTRR